MTLDNPDRVIPRSDQLSAGYEHQIGGHDVGQRRLRPRRRAATCFMTLSTTNKGVRAHDRLDQHRSSGRIRRSQRGRTRSINAGETDYDALLLQLEKRLPRNFSARVSYTLSSARGNTSRQWPGAINFQVGQDLNLR